MVNIYMDESGDEVNLIRDNRTVKVASGNSLF